MLTDKLYTNSECLPCVGYEVGFNTLILGIGLYGIVSAREQALEAKKTSNPYDHVWTKYGISLFVL